MTGDTRPYHSETHSDDRYDCWPISFRLGSRGHITTPLHMTGHTRSTPYDWWHTQKSVEFSCDSWRGVSTVTDIVTNERQCLWCYERETMSDIKDSWRGVSTVNTLQHTATHCNTLQHTATHCTTLQHTATHCNTLQHTATHCNTLQHTATHCNTLQHTATHCNSCDSWRGVSTVSTVTFCHTSWLLTTVTFSSCVVTSLDEVNSHLLPTQQALQNYTSLLQNIVSFIGLFCKRDLQF